MEFFTPVWKTKDVRKMDRAVAAAQKETNPKKLRKIALGAVFPPVMRAAVDKISDPAILREIVEQSAEEKTVFYALEKITDQEILYSLYKGPNRFYGFNKAVASRIRQQDILRKIFADCEKGEVCDLIYDKLLSPTFEETMKAGTRKAHADLLTAVLNMEYPKDRERLLNVLNAEKGPDCFGAVLDKLSFEQESKIVSDLIQNGSGEKVYELVKHLQYPRDRELLVRILEDNSRRNREIKKAAAKKFPVGEEILETDVCPYCGSVSSVFYFSEYDDGADMFTAGYSCRVCKHKEAVYTAYGVNPKDFSVSLREWIKK